MKLYNIFFYLFICALLASSCTKTENEVFSGEFLQLPLTFTGMYPKLNDGESVDLGISVSVAGPLRSSAVNYTFEVVDTSSTAVEGFHYTVESFSGTIPANSGSAMLPIKVIDDNIADGEKLILTVRLVSSDIELNPNYIEGEYSIEVICGESDLATEFTYENFDNFTGETITGEDALTIFENQPGQYKVNDFSFGSWEVAYGISDVPTGTMLFRENCGVISMRGTDNYGDVWEMTEVVASGGPEFTFKYENTYGEFGTVTMRKKDGSNWPLLNFE